MGGGEGENEHAVAGWGEEEEEEDKGARRGGFRERERERRETRNVVEGVSDARRKAANTRGRGTPGEKRAREEGAGRTRGGGVWIEK